MRKMMAFAMLPVALGGCATSHTPVPLTADEKKAVKSGKLIRLTDVNPPFGAVALNKGKLPNGVAVCASAFDFPTVKCYPELSKLVSRYLSDRGVPIAKDQASSDAILYFNAAFWFEGHMPNRDFSWALEQWLQQGKSKFDTVDGKGRGGMNEAGAILTAGVLHLGGLGLLQGLMASGGGHYTDRHWVSISLAKVDTKNAVLSTNGFGPFHTNASPALWGKTYNDVQRFQFSGRYVGPAEISASSLPLFEQAVKETLDRVVIAM